MQEQDFGVAWARFVAIAVTCVSGLYLVMVLSFGAFLLTTDFSPIACFDGDEPACAEPAPGAAGLGAIRASSWALASVAVLAIVAALGMTLRVRRLASALPVAALASTSGVIAHVLYSRL
jgi:hypothetical protein